MAAGRAGLLFALAATLPAPILAQTPIQYGETAAGELTSGDPQLSNGSHFTVFGFFGSAGDSIGIALRSEHFDANLILADETGNPVSNDDDTGGACHAYISAVLAAGGTYQVIVNARNASEIGAFELELGPGVGPSRPGQPCSGFPPPAGIAAVGETNTGSLTPAGSAPFDSWVVPPTLEGPVTIEVVATDFAPALAVTTPRGDVLGLGDPVEGCGSRIVFEPTGDPVRVVTSANPGEGGAYTLHLTAGSSGSGSTQCATAGPVDDISQLAIGNRFLAMGQVVDGRLTTDDVTWARDGTRLQAWAIDGRQGDEVTIDVTSSDIDPFLIVLGPGLDAPLTDDDGAGGCGSRVTFEFPATDTYRIVVNHQAGGPDVGRFRILATPRAGPVAPGPCQPRGRIVDDPGDLALFDSASPEGRVPIDSLVVGTLSTESPRRSDGTRFAIWELQGTWTETVTIEARSTTLDPFLYLVGPGIQRPLMDDNGGGGCDARITITFPQTGGYRVVMNPARAPFTGQYTIFVTRNASAPRAARC